MILIIVRVIDVRDLRGGEVDGSCGEGMGVDQRGVEIYYGGGVIGAGEGGGRKEMKGEGGVIEIVCCFLGVQKVIVKIFFKGGFFFYVYLDIKLNYMYRFKDKMVYYFKNNYL